MQDIKESVSRFYGQDIQKTEDLEYSACCTTDYDSSLTARLTDEVLDKRYGCGSPIPESLEGSTVLDLGCGAGADCFIAAQLVGESGRVIGVEDGLRPDQRGDHAATVDIAGQNHRRAGQDERSWSRVRGFGGASGFGFTH